MLLPLALGACGFTPAYGTKGAAGTLLNTVHAADPYDKNGFDFVKRIEERFGPPTNPLYDLTYTIRTSIAGEGITSDGVITRYNLMGALDWTLTRRRDNLRMTGGHIDQFASYSTSGATIAGLTAETDAALRLMWILADEVAQRMVAASIHFPP